MATAMEGQETTLVSVYLKSGACMPVVFADPAAASVFLAAYAMFRKWLVSAGTSEGMSCTYMVSSTLLGPDGSNERTTAVIDFYEVASAGFAVIMGQSPKREPGDGDRR